MQQYRQWTNKSVLIFAAGSDPIESMIQRAKREVQRAMQRGWKGPPFDPFELADHMGIALSPRIDIIDARVLPVGAKSFKVEYNPERPRGRMRFSVAHEIAHTLFPDCRETSRNRLQLADSAVDNWQLELLCNIAAAEFLMPVGSGLDPKNPVTVDNLLLLQQQFDVSTEAIAIRVAKITQAPCTIFTASKINGNDEGEGYSVEYSVPSRTSKLSILRGTTIEDRILSQCTAVGYTAKREHARISNYNDVHLECVGIPPYPGHVLPRIVAIASAGQLKPTRTPSVLELYGDALEPRGEGRRLIAHIVNDKTANWGAGFGRTVRERYPMAQLEFRRWVSRDPTNLNLGNVHVSTVSDDLLLVHMIAQHGYGESYKPRLRYDALVKCLRKVKDISEEQHASVHMPRIGTGYAGGNWSYILELVDEYLARAGVPVTVYTLPGDQPVHEVQGSLRLGIPG
jgi:Zn-dependent peptidase ImmA (M78 family)